MSTRDAMQDAQRAFLEEARELLTEMEDILLGLEEGADAERVNALFRAAHTIKGSSGLFGFDAVVRFTHVVESVLDALRDGEIGVSPDLVATLLPCRDHIGVLLDLCARGEPPPLEVETGGRELLARLDGFLGKAGPQSIIVAADMTDAERIEPAAQETGNWHLSLRFGRDSFRNGMDPLSFIRFLSTLGEITHLTTLDDGLPDADEMDPETCYLGFEIDLKSGADKAAIENVFEFVREDSAIRILPASAKAAEFIALIQSLPEDEARLGEILVKGGVLTPNELEDGLKAQQRGTDRPLGEILVEQSVVQPAVMDAAITKQKQSREAKAREAKSIRVDAERLDHLIDLVGELVIAGAGALARVESAGDAALCESVATVMAHIETLRESALRLRMIPVGTTFARFQRVVRDVSAELGKDIRLEISGGDTEVDKTVAELIADPLMHLVRNSLDHGLEKPDRRRAAGKPAQGVLALSARHESGNIVIEVRDDGAGLNRDRILAKGVERGLVQPGAALADKEVWSLIFEAGFSTAESVSNLSGRGVGMDVVRRNITALRGVIDVDSQSGRGAVFTLRLPLTLAIIDGFRVTVGEAHCVIPLEAILECVDLPCLDHDHDYMELRGEVLPIIRLRDFYGIEAEAPKRPSVVVVRTGETKAGLVVDRLLGEFQTVIKPLGKLFGGIPGMGGFTLLGSGEVAFVLDVAAMVRAARGRAAPVPA